MKHSVWSLSLALFALAGCQQAMVAKKALDTALAESVHVYCRLPEPARLANRERIAAKVAPDRIEILCAGDLRSGG